VNILFVVNEAFFSENLGVMLLSSIVKKEGHATRMLVLMRHDIPRMLADFDPDIIAYSAMTPDMKNFSIADKIIRKWADKRGKPIFRIMGGPHPTFFPEIVDEMDLDAICVGEGDNALVGAINAWREGSDLAEVCNIIPRGGSLGTMKKELVTDLDSLPFADRDIFYEAVPHFKLFQQRSIIVGRGCPYKCTYCHNEIFNKTFKGCGPILRRRSVDDVMEELKYIVKEYGPVTQIRFGDDTFAYKVDDWLNEFLTRYKNEIGLPYYCLIRSNVFTEDMAKIMAETGCVSVSMSIESGNEKIRNEQLKRNISNATVERSFAYARKYNIKVKANSMLAIPGSTIEDDMYSFHFARKLKAGMPTFGIWAPFPKTGLTEYAMQHGLLEAEYRFDSYFHEKSALNNYTEQEKDIQINISKLGTLFCDLPDAFLPLFNRLIRMKNNWAISFVGSSYWLFKFYIDIFYSAAPKNPIALAKLFTWSIKYMLTNRRLHDPDVTDV